MPPVHAVASSIGDAPVVAEFWTGLPHPIQWMLASIASSEQTCLAWLECLWHHTGCLQGGVHLQW